MCKTFKRLIIPFNLAVGVVSFVMADEPLSLPDRSGLDVSTTSLSGQRLFFSEEERQRVNSLDPLFEETESVSEQPSLPDEASVSPGDDSSNESANESVKAVDRTNTRSQDVSVRYQAMLESASARRLIINGLPCEVDVMSLNRRSDETHVVRCATGIVPPKIQLRFLPESKELEVQVNNAVIKSISPGDAW